MPKLVVTLNDGTEVTHDLDAGVITIGRLSDNLIQIDDASVSSHHAQLAAADGGYQLKDLNSTNGTRHNGQSVQDAELEDGDTLRFGKIAAQYISDTPKETLPLPEAEKVAATVADSSRRPENFANASPFKGKARKKDALGRFCMGFAVVSILAFCYTLLRLVLLQPPQ